VLRAATGTSTTTFSQLNTIDINPANLDPSINPAPYRVRVGYNKNYTVQTNGLLGSAVQSHVTYIHQSDIYASASSSTVLSDFSRPNDLAPISGALLSQTNAQTVANELVTLWSTRRRLYEVTVPLAVGLTAEIGSVVTLVWPMDDLGTGQVGQVVGDTFTSADATMILSVLV
jgi:hypothetical protein